MAEDDTRTDNATDDRAREKLLLAYVETFQPLPEHGPETGEWSGRLTCWSDGEAWPCRLVRNARKAGLLTKHDPPGFLASPEQCTYENRWTDEVGTIPVCTVHENNSKHEPSDDPHRPCLSVDPYPAFSDPRYGPRDD